MKTLLLILLVAVIIDIRVLHVCAATISFIKNIIF